MDDASRALKDKLLQVLDLANQLQVATAELRLMETQENLKRRVPGGYAIDYLGDGKVKPANECKKVPD